MEKFQVTLKRGEDIQAFYDDMETPGGNLTIPNRKVECDQRLATSRTTGYWLTIEEAMEVAKDPRVEQVVPQVIIDREQTRESQVITGRFDKGSSPTGAGTFTKSDGSTGIKYNVDHKSWGILRHTETTSRANWGQDDATSSNRYEDDSVTIIGSGKNVDIVIVENHSLAPAHPDYVDNYVEYNWGQHFNTISGGLWPNYTYSNVDSQDNFGELDNHPTAVTSYACGKLFGIAKDANIYQLSTRYEQKKIVAEGVTDGNGFYTTSDRAFAYIREFHANKPINPATGRKNPTVVNLSLSTYVNMSNGITYGSFRGTPNDKGKDGTPYSQSELQAMGIHQSDSDWTSNTDFQVTSGVINSDQVDAIAEGVIVISAAGNDNRYHDAPGGTDYDNYIVDNAYYDYRDYQFNGQYFYREYYCRGDKFYRSGAINVGALGPNTDEARATFSNYGPAIHCYVSGQQVPAAANESDIAFGIPYPGEEDNVGTWYTFGFGQGTSYSSPILAGFICCLVETYPHMTNDDVKAWIQKHCLIGQMADTGDAINVDTNTKISIDGSTTTNRIFYWKNYKNTVGNLANNTYGFEGRPETGAVYPRFKKRFKG